MNLEIEFINETDYQLEEYETLFESLAKTGLTMLKVDGDIEFSISVISNQRIHEINREYRHIDRVTDVITFALEDEQSPFVEGMPRLLGDIFISYDRAVEQASDYGHSLKREMSFLFVHGLLHLLGYDHMEKEEKKIMNDLQEKILSLHQIERK